MNIYEIEQYLNDEFQQSLYGGAENNENVEITDQRSTSDNYKFPIYEAKYTRPIMSVFEYTKAITTLAEDLATKKTLAKYLDETEIKNFINPSFLAFYIIDNKKWDATIIRNGNEKITFSTLYQNPRWRELILDLIDKKNKSLEEEFKPIYDAMRADSQKADKN